MCLIKAYKRWRKKRRDRIIEGPCMDGGVRTRIDEDAPKHIESTELTSFICKFSLVSMIDLEIDIANGEYSLIGKLGSDGASLSAECIYGADMGKRVEKSNARKELIRIEKLIREHDIARFNGQYYHVSGLPRFFGASLEAEYESGEKIYCYNNQDFFFPLEFVKEICDIFGLNKE